MTDIIYSIDLLKLAGTRTKQVNVLQNQPSTIRVHITNSN